MHKPHTAAILSVQHLERAKHQWKHIQKSTCTSTHFLSRTLGMRVGGNIRNRIGNTRSFDNPNSPNSPSRKSMARLAATKETKDMDSSARSVKTLEGGGDEDHNNGL
jgi:hypothetical protein